MLAVPVSALEFTLVFFVANFFANIATLVR